MKCPVCDGEGGWNESYGEGNYMLSDCPYCEGKGKITLAKWLGHHLWERMPEWMWDIYIWIMYNESDD